MNRRKASFTDKPDVFNNTLWGKCTINLTKAGIKSTVDFLDVINTRNEILRNYAIKTYGWVARHNIWNAITNVTGCSSIVEGYITDTGHILVYVTSFSKDDKLLPKLGFQPTDAIFEGRYTYSGWFETYEDFKADMTEMNDVLEVAYELVRDNIISDLQNERHYD